MGTPIYGRIYRVTTTPDGDEHPNIEMREIKEMQKPLTDEEIWKIVNDNPSHRFELARAIEKAHGIE